MAPGGSGTRWPPASGPSGSSFGAERLESVDWYHASEHLWGLAKTLNGEGTRAATTWAAHATHRLWPHGPDPLLALLRETAAPTPAAAKHLATERGSFATNAARMQYPTFRRQGLPVGSGAVEAEAKRLVRRHVKVPMWRQVKVPTN